jgi:hypothetical protein
MSTQRLDLIIQPLGNTIALSFETERFRPTRGNVVFAPVPNGYTANDIQIFGNNLVGTHGMNGAQVTNDIGELARVCGHLEGFVSGILNHDGGTILLKADIAEREAFRLANLLYEALGDMLYLSVLPS